MEFLKKLLVQHAIRKNASDEHAQVPVAKIITDKESLISVAGGFSSFRNYGAACW